jgi:hypothetical protein
MSSTGSSKGQIEGFVNVEINLWIPYNQDISYNYQLLNKYAYSVLWSTVLINNHAIKAYEDWSYSFTILDLGTRRKWVVSLIHCPVYPEGKGFCMVAYLVEALCYKPEVRGFDSRWDYWIFNWPNSSSRTMALGSIQPLTEMSTRNLPGGKGRPTRKADNLTANCEPIVYKMWEPRPLTSQWASQATYRFLFTQCVWGWVGRRSSQESGEEKNFFPLPWIELRPPSPLSFAIAAEPSQYSELLPQKNIWPKRNNLIFVDVFWKSLRGVLCLIHCFCCDRGTLWHQQRVCCERDYNGNQSVCLRRGRLRQRSHQRQSVA